LLRELPSNSGTGLRYVAFALAPDGQLIVAAATGAVEWLRVADGQLVKRDPVPATPMSLAFSDDGTLLAVGTHDAAANPYVNRVLIWNLATDQIVQTLTLKCAPLNISMDHARRLLAVSSGWGCSDVAFEPNGGVSLWSLERGEEIPLEAPTANDGEGIVAFTHDGQALMRRDRFGLHFWDTGTGSYLRNEGEVRPFTSQSEDRVVFASEGFVNVARTGPFWVQEYVPPE
jgi:WD40 repeat protein